MIEDVGRLARFSDRDGDDWTYGMLVAIERDGVFLMVPCEHDSAESFFYCEVQSA